MTSYRICSRTIGTISKMDRTLKMAEKHAMTRSYTLLIASYLLSMQKSQSIMVKKKCLVRMSNVFSVTDEAYALLMVENYYERWVSLSEKKNINEGGEGVQESRIKRAKYTCSSQGNIHAGWEEKGILRFNEIAGMIKNQRKDKTRNDNLDDALITHWKGMKRDTCRRKPEKVAATRAYRDDETEI